MKSFQERNKLPEHKAAFVAAVKKVQEQMYEDKIRNKDGKLTDFDVTYNVLRYDFGKQCVVPFGTLYNILQSGQVNPEYGTGFGYQIEEAVSKTGFKLVHRIVGQFYFEPLKD